MSRGDVLLSLTREEAEMLTEALAAYPDPEMVSFGPAYAIRREEAEMLAERIRKALEGRR